MSDPLAFPMYAAIRMICGWQFKNCWLTGVCR